jgi:ubiquitin C-terminal hydrolase
MLGTVSTSEIKLVISKVNKQVKFKVIKFTGFSQQDAHEFLVTFLDSLGEDINRISRKVIKEVSAKKITESEAEAFKRVEDLYFLRNNSIVTDLFQGFYKNTITCPECLTASIHFEPFLSLNLPVLVVQKVDVFVLVQNESKEHLCLSIYVPEEAIFYDLPNFLNKYLNDKLGNCRYLLVKNSETVKLIKNTEKIYDVSHKGLIFCIEMLRDNYAREDYFPAITMIKEANSQSKELFSFPRIFNLNNDMKVKEVKLKLFRFMRKFLVVKNSELYNKVDKEGKDYESALLQALEKEYHQIFFSQDLGFQTLKNNFPFEAILLSKDGNRSTVFGRENKYKDEDSMAEIMKEIKAGSKLTIELSNKTSEFLNQEELKNINKFIKVSPKESGKTTNIYDLLNTFNLNEKLDKANEWFCGSCNKNQTALKRMEIYKAPKQLIIQLNRFGLVNKKVEKNKELIDFPIEDLNLSKYLNQSHNTKAIYELYGLTMHSGSTEGGHYTAIVKSFEGWQEFNDSSVYPVERDSLVSEDVYLLFYKQISI